MANRIFRRKIYDQIKLWKEENDGKSALLIEGADVSENLRLSNNSRKMNMSHTFLLTSINAHKTSAPYSTTWMTLTMYS